MTEQSALQRLLTFLAASPTPFHATSTIAERLVAAGYSELDEREVWPSGLSGRHFVRRNASSIIAWRGDSATAAEQGIRMVGAHTDSPCLKVKPNATLRRNGYYQLGVEVYGGALLNPWFDRDLSLAGRVSYQVGSESRSALIDFRCPIAVIPSLAIHLDREANKNREVNPQQHLPVLLSMDASESRDFDDLMLEQLLREHPECGAERVLAAELSFYDTQVPAVIGIQGEFVASARLDNLLSCFAGLEALCSSESSSPAMLVCNDHEEIGSTSAAGADGPMLLSLLTRLLPDPDVRERALSRSMMISSDNAHAIHPNYADRHDGNHGPLINGGPVIKVNANQRYATNSETAAAFRLWCDQEVVPVQTFVTRSDLGCGSTIGPITSAKTGVRTLDVGLPTFAMHSIRELAGSQDLDGFCRVLSRFYDSPLP